MSNILNGENTPELFAAGRSAVCCMCDKKITFSAAVSGWRFVQLGPLYGYVCPDHLPPDGSSAHEFQLAYQVIFRRLSDAR